MIDPASFRRRIPAYRTHQAMGAVFSDVNKTATPATYGDAAGEAVQMAELAAVDLTALPRCGFKGPGALEWLKAKGVAVPDAANRVMRQRDGGLCLRLGAADILLTGDPPGRSNRPEQLRAAWAADRARPIGWDAHREDGLNWFLLAGRRVSDVMARTCAVDFSLRVFADLDVAQTQAIGLSGIIARADLAALPCLHLFFDMASSDYLIERLENELSVLGGRFVGIDAVRASDGFTA